jgi:hypothetical protein
VHRTFEVRVLEQQEKALAAPTVLSVSEAVDPMVFSVQPGSIPDENHLLHSLAGVVPFGF